MSDETITKGMLDSAVSLIMAKMEANHSNTTLRLDNLEDNFDLKLKGLDFKVDKIQEQTTRTNGRVTNLETKPHPIANCPQAELIAKLRDDMVENTAERKFTMKMAAAIATVIGIVISALGLLI
jgi:hypothetical protein